MISTPLKQGFLPSSTPVQSQEDSGYFGSCNKSSFSKSAHKLSPIKESSPFKKRIINVSELPSLDSSDISTKEDCSFTSNVKEFQSYFDKLEKGLDFHNLSESAHDSCINNSQEYENRVQGSFPSFLIHDLEQKIISLNQRAAHFLHQDKHISLNLDTISDQTNKEINNSKVFQKSGETFHRIIYRKLDILGDLMKCNHAATLKRILAYLSPADLTKVYCVSKKWKEVVLCDVKANSRRKEFLKDRQDHKENDLHLNKILKFNHKGEARQPVGLHKNVLSDIKNIKSPVKQPLVTQSNKKFDSFIKEGKKLTSGTLRKCPKCEYAAKSQVTDQYLCTNCDYSFCGNCLNPLITRKHSCPKSTVSIVIGSKKSKKNLRRL